MLSLLAHLFWPRQSNNLRPKILHTSSLSLIVSLLLLSQVIVSLLSGPSPRVLGYAANISVEEVVRLTNEKRTAQGLNALEFNQSLAAAALAKGQDMLEDDYWAHVAPDGTEPWKFFRDVSYKYKYAGENLARDFTNAGSAVEAWMASPTHRDNLLSPKYREIGVAVVEGDMNGTDTTIIVQLFGTKLSDYAAASVTATPQPTTVPVAVATVAPAVLTPGVAGEKRVLVSPFSVTKSVSLILITILLVALAIDGIVIGRRRIVRVGGRSLAHLSFLGMVLAIVIIAKAGKIL